MTNTNPLDNMGDYTMPTDTETTNVVDAALEAGALFEVQSEPMSVAGTVPTIAEGKYAGEPLQKVVYRAMGDGPKVLNVVHPSFPESNYLQVVETAEALFPESCVGLSLVADGERLTFTQEIGKEIDLGGGDTLRPNLLWTASLNSTWSTGCHGLAQRFFCSNQLPLAKAHIKVRRTTNHDLTLSLRAEIMATVMDRMDVFAEKVTSLKRILVTPLQADRVIRSLIKEPAEDAHGKTINAYERKMAAIRYYMGEEANGPAAGTAWAVWNAVQSAESHSFTEGKAQQVRQVDMVVNEAQPLTEKVESRLLALV